MSVIADVSIPADQFALGDVLEVRPGVQVRLESLVPTGGSDIPYFWVASPDVEAVESVLRDSPFVESVKVVDRLESEALFRVGWTAAVDGVIEAITDTDAVVLGGAGHGDHWTFQLRFADSQALSRFYRTLVDKGISVDLDGLHNALEEAGRPGAQLTNEQREALVVALESGYFAVPRETTLVELAEELGISDSAVSQRIRRGLARLLSNAMI